MTEAFERLGHDVRHLGTSTGTAIWGGHVDKKYEHKSDGDLTAHWEDWQPDLVVHMDSAYEYRHPVYSDTVHVVYGMDNHVRDYRSQYVDHYFLAHKAVSIMPWQDDMIHLPCGYDPTIHTPSPIGWHEREFDVAMIGVLYPQRVAVLDALAAAGLKVFAGTGLLGAEYAAAYHNARIALNVSAAGDLSQRVFEGMAMGCHVLTDPLADLATDQLAQTVAGYSEFTGVEGVAEIAQTLINHPTEHTRYEAGWAHPSLEQHTWDARAQVIIDWYEERYGISGDRRDSLEMGTVEPPDSSEDEGRRGLTSKLRLW